MNPDIPTPDRPIDPLPAEQPAASDVPEQPLFSEPSETHDDVVQTPSMIDSAPIVSLHNPIAAPAPIPPSPSPTFQPSAPIPPSLPPMSGESLSINTPYESNPFLNTARGLVEILRFNAGTSMLTTLILVIPIFFLYGMFLFFLFSGSILLAAIGSIIFLVGLLIYVPLLSGVMAAVAAETIEGHHATMGRILKRGVSKFFPLLGLILISSIIMSFGFLLLIVPGMIFLGRSSLAFLLVFEEDLGPIKALKRSFELTKGHTIEMLGSIFAGYLMSGGYLLLPATILSPFVGRYQDLKRLKASGLAKPVVHWLNYLAVIVPVVFFAAFIGIEIVLVTNALTKIKPNVTTTPPTASTSPTPPSSNFQFVNANALPYCGVIPTASMSAVTLSYVDAVMTETQELYPISLHIKSDNNLADSQDYTNKIALDKQLLATIAAIPFTGSTAQDAAVYESSIQSNDVLLTQEIAEYPNLTDATQNAVTAAEAVRSTDAQTMRHDLGLPVGTCGFYSP